MNWTLLINSLLVALATASAAAGLGFLAALLAMLLESRARRWLLLAGIVCLVLPPFLVLNCWLHLLGLGGIWRGWLPADIYSVGGAVWILSLLLWPISLLLILGAWQRLEPAQLEVEPALVGGALIRWLLWPAARGAIGQAFVVTFVLALNNFAVPALLQVKVYPAEVWVQFNTTFDYTAALRLSWPLVAAPLVLLGWLRHREVAWPRAAGPVPPRLFQRQLGRPWDWSAGFWCC